MHEGVAALRREFLGVHGRLGDRLAAQHDLGAEALGALDLGERRRQRHDDQRLDAEAPRVERHALRVVAGRRRGDAGGRVGQLREALQLEAAAAVLERAGELQVLELEEQPRAEHLGQARRGDGRRALDVRLDGAVRSEDVLGRDRHRGAA